MSNEEARRMLKHILADLESISDSRVNMDNPENLEKAIKLLRELYIWPYED